MEGIKICVYIDAFWSFMEHNFLKEGENIYGLNFSVDAK